MNLKARIYSSFMKIKCKYNIKENKINFTCTGKSSMKGVYVIDKYENNILYMYLQEKGKKKMGKLKKILSH